jgi:hypothetical protein
MKSFRTPLLLLLLAVLSAGSRAHPVVADGVDHGRCSLSWAPIRAAEVFFVGLAGADTVPAGPGAMIRPERFPVRLRIYGQVVRVQLLNSGAPANLRSALASAEHPNVVVVPWSHDEACQPRYWRGSARWLTAELEGFYEASLRPEELWAGGLPTFDVRFPAFTPYPHAGVPRPGTGSADERLSPSEYFELYSALPTEREWNPGAPEAADRLLLWETANPLLARRYPADVMLPLLKRHFGLVSQGN